MGKYHFSLNFQMLVSGLIKMAKISLVQVHTSPHDFSILVQMELKLNNLLPMRRLFDTCNYSMRRIRMRL